MTYVDSEILFDLTTTQQELYLKKANLAQFSEPNYSPGYDYDWVLGTRDTADYYEVYFIKETGTELNIEDDIYYYDYNLIERVVDIIDSHKSYNPVHPLRFAVDDIAWVETNIIEQIIDNVVSNQDFVKIEHLPTGIKTEGYETE